MIALLDTNIVLAQFSSDENPVDLSGFEDLRLSSLSYSEMLAGLGSLTDIEVYRERHARLRKVQYVYGEGIPYNDRCAEAMEWVIQDVRVAGRNPRARLIDSMLAATAIAHDLTLVTRNEADFRGIRNLRIEVR